MPVTSSNTVTLDGSYELVQFTEGKLAPTLPLKNTQLTAKLEAGKLTGNGGINDYSASYTTSKDLPPSQISVSEVVSTLKAGPQNEMDQERRFFEGLRAASGISYGDGTIALTWDNAQKSLVLRRR
jgi:heat shock protein HslJ